MRAEDAGALLTEAHGAGRDLLEEIASGPAHGGIRFDTAEDLERLVLALGRVALDVSTVKREFVVPQAKRELGKAVKGLELGKAEVSLELGKTCDQRGEQHAWVLDGIDHATGRAAVSCLLCKAVVRG